MAHFKTWDSAGKNLVDSNYVTMGLIKSGYMVKITDAQRRARIALNNNNTEPVPYTDPVYGFTVTADTPLVFIAGRAVLQQIVRNGNSYTFWYAHASTSARYYVFDRMKDLGSGPAKLRLWTDVGVCTLDSGMPFLDINGAHIPPNPSVNAQGYGRGYAGAATQTGTATAIGGADPNHINASILMDSLSIAVGGDCAACLPWSRIMLHTDRFGGSAISAREGAFGQGGNLTFMMATEAGCTINGWVSSGYINMFYQIPTPRKPSVTYIDASTLPIPFG
ncbi:hypothetical protein MCB86_03755 [Pseudomonas sp. KSR10]|uniref:hypothetical protein n=1 Tax=Pseudomonas sp. KSR10 TaxID=2916654 RepID=UPI001EF91171|nr:hypothetical protein [Pseudomonas sp. KSR10]MCG6539189.1 hypothetical protein [Pseudomonas sp. KSR10]